MCSQIENKKLNTIPDLFISFLVEELVKINGNKKEGEKKEKE